MKVLLIVARTMQTNMKAKIREQLTVKQSSSLTTVGTIAEEDLDSAASSPDLTRADASSGSDASVESEQNLLMMYRLLLFCPRMRRSNGDAGSPTGT